MSSKPPKIKRHSLLRRQLKTLRISSAEDIKDEAVFEEFLSRIETAYKEYDREREQLERSLNISSSEMMERSQDLAKSEARAKSIFEHVGTSMIVLDMDFAIIDINHVFTEVFKYSLLDVTSMRFSKLGADAEEKQVIEEKLSLLRQIEDENIRFENKYIDSHGIPIFCETTFAFVRDHANESESRVIVQVQDITEIKKYQVQLAEAADKAEYANQTKSAFLANMSHELRTPMHGILSFAKFGSKDCVGKREVPKTILKSHFDKILDSGSRLMALLNDLLDLSKLEANKVDYNMCSNQTLVVIDSILGEFSQLSIERNLNFEFDREADSPIAFFDKQKIQQVVSNLISNAIKFSTSGSSIKITTVPISKGGVDYVRIAIVNYGVGIPQDELDLVFDKFIQSSKTKSRAGGTGLGLAICKKIIEDHGGRIWAESGDGGITTFAFILRAHETKL